MSEKDFKRFLRDLDRVADMRSAVEALRPAGRAGTEVPADALVALARERGYDIDAEDIAPHVAELDELDESELEDVAAGVLRATGISGESRDTQNAAGDYKWIDVLSWSGGYDWHKN